MLTIASAISIASLFPAIIISLSIFRKKLLFTPFLLLTLISGVIEFTALGLRFYGLNNVWIYNIGILVQYLFIVRQLSVWGLFDVKSLYIKASIILIGFVWLLETISYRNLSLNNYTLVVCSLLLVVYITAYINKLIFENVRNLLTDSRFLISIGYLIYFSISLIVFIFTRNAKDFSYDFFTNIWAIHNIVNTFTNIIFIIALLCIPKR